MPIKSSKKTLFVLIALSLLLLLPVNFTFAQETPPILKEKLPDNVRAQQIKDLKFGMFICWSLSTFSGQEVTGGKQTVAAFKATGCDTDQWCRTAKEAGMTHIMFLARHVDGFCLWDTKTTDFKVTKSALKKDVLAEVRKSCTKYGLKLALYYAQANATWGRGNAEAKKEQLKELCTKYGPIEYWFMDYAGGDGGLNHKETRDWVLKFQPNTFVGFTHGQPAGRIVLGKACGGRTLAKDDGYSSTLEAIKKLRETFYPDKPQWHPVPDYLLVMYTYPILPPHKGGADWFYSLPKHDNLCYHAAKLYKDYLVATRHGNIFVPDVGPNYEGKLREIDVKTLREVGRMIRENKKLDSNRK